MTHIQNSYGYEQPQYVRRSREEAQLGFLLATVASAAVMKALPPFSNPFLRQMTKEHASNHLYQDAFIKSLETSGLAQKGLTCYHMDFSPEELKKVGTTLENKIEHLDVKKGLNAFYSPNTKSIHLNANKACISGFHELGHARNHLQSKLGKVLQKLRRPGYTIAGLMGYVALFERNKPREAERNFMDKIEDNCGKIAFAAMLPTVAEEALASRNGIKIAREAGLAEPLIKNLKKFYGKALLSYSGYALLTGVSVFIASKITEIFTRPKKVEPRF